MFFTWLDWGCGLGGIRPQRWSVIFLSKQGYILSVFLITVTVDLDQLNRVVFVRFIYQRLLFFFLSTLYSLEEVTTSTPHLGNGGVVLSSEWGVLPIFSQFFCKGFPLLPCILFVHSFLSVLDWIFIYTLELRLMFFLYFFAPKCFQLYFQDSTIVSCVPFVQKPHTNLHFFSCSLLDFLVPKMFPGSKCYTFLPSPRISVFLSCLLW